MSQTTTKFTEFNLDENILKSLEFQNFTTATPIQTQAIPVVMQGKDIVASAATGTGKTLAFLLPAIHRLSLNPSKGKPRVLVLSPTRELATQISAAALNFSKFMRLNVVSLVGGMPYRQQLRDLSRSVDVVVATPGRLLDHMKSGKIDLSAIEILILDEGDRMLDMGFIDDVNDIADATPKSRQTLLFSATVNNEVASMIRSLLKNPVRIEIEREKNQPVLIKQELYVADNPQHKARLLQHFLDNGEIYKGIIFSATKINADNLARDLMDQGYSAAALHGDLKQNVRNRTVDLLRRGKIQFLIATDIAARGIDISDISHVINYDLPKFSEDYVHRIGRTGRAGKTGVAISFALPMDARHLQKIERYTGQKIAIEVVEGLEPTKRLSASGSGSDRGNSRGGKSNGGFKSGGKSFRDKSFGGKSRSNGSRFEESRGESRFAKKSSDGARSRFDDAPRGGSRFKDKNVDAPRSSSRFNDRSDAPRSGSRFSDNTDYAPRDKGVRFSDRSETPRSSSRFKDKQVDAPRSGSRFSDRSEAPRGGARFNDQRSDTPRGGSRFNDNSDFAPRDRGSRFSDRSEAPRSGSRFKDKQANAPRSGSRFSDRSDAQRGNTRFNDQRSDSPRARSEDRGSRFKSDAPKRFEAARTERNTAPKGARGARFDGVKNKAKTSRSESRRDNY